MTATPSNVITSILGDLVRLGVSCRRDGDDLVLRPRKSVPPPLVDLIRRHKGELLDRLSVRGRDSPSQPPADRRGEVFKLAEAAGFPSIRLPHRLCERVLEGRDGWQRFTDCAAVEDVVRVGRHFNGDAKIVGNATP